MSAELELRFLVDSRMTDCFNLCRPSALLGFLQETATEHFFQMACSRAQLIEQYGVVWIMTRQWYRLDTLLRAGDTVTVRTWQRGGVGAVVYRDYDLFVGETRVGEAVACWALLDVDTHRPARISRVPLIRDAPRGEHPKAVLLEKLSPPEGIFKPARRAVYYSDCDHNGHMNNIRYADFACDAFGYEAMEGRYVRSMQIDYRAECRAGEELNLSVERRGERIVVAGADDLGKTRFIAETGFFEQKCNRG